MAIGSRRESGRVQASPRNERAACQEHFIDLCRLLDEPTPNSDPTGEDYAFEKGATRFTGQQGWADVWPPPQVLD